MTRYTSKVHFSSLPSRISGKTTKISLVQMSDAVRASIASAITAAHRYQSDSNETNTSTLDLHFGVSFEFICVNFI